MAKISYKKNNYIIISNHPCYLDALIIHFYCLFKLHFRPLIMANKSSYSKIRYISKLFGIKIVLNDFKGIRKTIDYLENGKSVLIFPEGHLTKYSTKLYRGFLHLAQKTHTNILPIVLNYKKFPLIKVKNEIRWDNRNANLRAEYLILHPS